LILDICLQAAFLFVRCYIKRQSERGPPKIRYPSSRIQKGSPGCEAPLQQANLSAEGSGDFNLSNIAATSFKIWRDSMSLKTVGGFIS
jgi:hypothetical protein